MQTIFDSIVIGGGLIGSSIAYHLARQGRHVLVVERAESAVEPAASWASAGGVRRQGRHSAEARLALEAIQRWRTLSQELDADLHYRQDGNLLVAETDAEAEELKDFVQQQHEQGFSDVQLLDRHQVRTIVPGLAEQVVAGSFSPADGQADPMLTTCAFVAAAQRYGAIYWNHTWATLLLTSGQRVIGLQTQQDAVYAEQVILAAGAWSDTLAATVGVRLPISMQALQMVLSTPAPTPVLKPVVSALHRMLSLKQLNDGSFLLGGGWLGELSPDRQSYAMIQEHIQGNWRTACELLPAVAHQQIARAWCGLEAHSIDDLPFIGAVPDVDGLLLALGFSGHGFAIAPAVGRCVADLIAGRTTPELDGLRPDRMSMFEDVSK